MSARKIVFALFAFATLAAAVAGCKVEGEVDPDGTAETSSSVTVR